MKTNSRILIVGHDDVIAQSLDRGLRAQKYTHVVSSAKIKLNVWDQAAVAKFFQKERPEYIFLASTKSGGIEANRRSGGDFIYSNLVSQSNVIHAAYRSRAKKLLFLSSSCVYPKESRQPMKPEYLFTGKLEATSEPYAVAKLAGITMCQAYRRQYGLKTLVMVPATIYGPGSDTNSATSHVLGALMGKFAAAIQRGDKKVVVWGRGKARREFLFVDDFVAAAEFLMKKYDGEEVINAGMGKDVPIRELAGMMAAITGFRGKIVFDKTKPDGTMRKLLDSSRLKKLGWKPRVELREGITKTWEWYKRTL